MSLTIRNNRLTMLARHEVSKNAHEQSNQLSKVSTGLKVRDAADAAAEYSISERMRCRIRGLNQSIENTQTGRSMIKTASKAVGEQTELMKKIMTIAMRASDDAYNNDDRVTLQKETKQLLTQIDEIAHETTYNGIHLLDQRTKSKETPWFNASTPYRVNPNGIIVASQLVNGNVSDNDLIDPNTGQTTTDPDVGIRRSPGKLDLDFDVLFAGGAQPNLDKIGFSLNCAGCSQFITVQFDTSTNSSNLYYGNSGSPKPMCYVVGVKDVTDSQSLMEAVFNGVSEASERAGGGSLPSSENTSATLATAHNVMLAYDASAGKVQITKNGPAMTLLNGTTGTMELAASFKPEQHLNLQASPQASQNTTMVIPNTTLDILFPPTSNNWDIDPTDSDYPPKIKPEDRVKWRNDTWMYPSHRVDLNPDNCLQTREMASQFLEYAEQAMKYLLHASTALGVQEARLEYMNDNLTTAHENLQSSESVFRDADMAKEMTKYVRANVLTNSSQAMLTQANQAAESVLGLLG